MDIRVGYGMSRNRGCYPMLSLRSSSGISAGLDPRPTAGLKMQRTQTEFIDRPPGTGSRIYPVGFRVRTGGIDLIQE